MDYLFLLLKGNLRLMRVLGDVLNYWTEGICVHRIYYNKPDLKSATMTPPPKSVRIVRDGLAPSCVLAL